MCGWVIDDLSNFRRVKPLDGSYAAEPKCTKFGENTWVVIDVHQIRFIWILDILLHFETRAA